MKYPQDIAQQLADCKNLQTIAKNCCLATVVLWCLGLDPENAESILLIDDAIKSKVLKSDCTVVWQPFIQWLTGREAEVEFVEITNIKKIKERTPVLYKYNGNMHWVGVENGCIRYNSIRDSQCVKYGKPVEMRVIKIKGLKNVKSY